MERRSGVLPSKVFFSGLPATPLISDIYFPVFAFSKIRLCPFSKHLTTASVSQLFATRFGFSIVPRTTVAKSDLSSAALHCPVLHLSAMPFPGLT